MSRLFRYSNLGETVLLRVDANELFPFAEDLHSCALDAVEECDDCEPADLAWSTAAAGFFQIALNGADWETPMDATEIFFQSENLLTRIFGVKLSDYFQLHSAAVARPGAGAWLICGPSRSGKTSLALSLMMAGWEWLTDELTLANVDDPLQLSGFRRNFNLKESSWSLFPETADLPHRRESYSGYHKTRVRFIDPETLRPGSFRPNAPLAGILFPEYRADTAISVCKRIGGVAATQILVPEITSPSAAAFQTIADWIRRVPAFHFEYANPLDIVDKIGELNSAPQEPVAEGLSEPPPHPGKVA